MENTTSTRFLEQAGDIASYYGFRPLREIDPALFKTHVGRAPLSFNNAAIMGAQCISAKQREPILAYYASSAPSHLPSHIPSREAGEFCLQVSGASASISEVIVLTAIVAILDEFGVPVLRVRVNAFGDRDSRERFGRELTAFVRRRFAHEDAEINEEERLLILAHPASIYRSSLTVVRDMLAEAPRPVHFLSERSRLHFKGLLEELEQVGLPYELDDALWGDERELRITFSLDLPDGSEMVFASSGGRYDDYVARLAGRRENATVHASIYFRKKGIARSAYGSAACTRPKLYFIQLGNRAKLQGLAVVDVLRRAHIPVAQSFDASQLTPQLSAAQNCGVSYALIMGQREALDGTVIVRSLRNNSQNIITLGLLPKYLRTLRV